MGRAEEISITRLKPDTFVYVQYLRGLAAALVVYFHTKVYDPQFAWPLERSFGYGGVDIFFVISGFIMTINNFHCPRAPHRFLWERARRIYPPYWIATTLAFALFALHPSAFVKAELDLRYVVYSYLLLPLDNATGTSHGVPFLNIAWTLVYEMWFYLLFAIALLISNAWGRLLAVAAFIVSAVAYGSALQPTSAPMGFFTAPMTIEFVFGCVVGSVVASDLSRAPRWILAAGFVVSLALFLVGGSHGDSFARVFYFGLPAAGLVFCAASLERAGLRLNWPLLLLLGDASYSIYLFHPFILTAVRLASAALHFGESPAAAAIGVCVSVLACLAAGTAAHFWIEKPLLALVKRGDAPRPRLATAAAE